MTKAEMKNFIYSMTHSIADELVKKVDDFPDDWDGHELRELLAIKFDSERTRSVMKGRRKREFDNVRIARNL